jgi:hypothetical protein
MLPMLRPLAAGYRWNRSPGVRIFCFNYWTVAVLRPAPGGRVAGVVRWQGREHEFLAGSWRLAERWVERWVAARDDFPGGDRLRRRLRR